MNAVQGVREGGLRAFVAANSIRLSDGLIRMQSQFEEVK
jgi:hypothetical protein